MSVDRVRAAPSRNRAQGATTARRATTVRSARRPVISIASAVAAFVIAFMALGCGSDAPAKPTRPNLLLISIDTLRADHLSAYGYARKTSPSIDELARNGILFEQAYSHSPKTAISHMSILTGLYPEAHGVVQHGFPDTRRLSRQIPTLATLLSRAGYRCGAITAGGNVAPELGFDQGMETFDLIDPPRVAFDRAFERMQQLSSPGPDGATSPFFLFVHTFEVHSPYAPAREFAERYVDPSYRGDVISSREELATAAGADWETRHTVYFDAIDRTDPEDLQRLVDLYDASILETDALLGQLLARARAAGLFDHTMVVLLSDHGEEFMEHGRLLHDQLYRELLHVPLIVSLPGSFAAGAGEETEPSSRLSGLRITPLVRMIDVAPTLLEWLSVPIPDHLQGASLVPLVEGVVAAPEPLLASSFERRGLASLQLGVWKLIERTDRDGARARELYDVSRDPAETTDLAPAKGGVVALLERRLRDLASVSRHLFATRGRGRDVRAGESTRERLRALGYLGHLDLAPPVDSESD